LPKSFVDYINGVEDGNEEEEEVDTSEARRLQDTPDEADAAETSEDASESTNDTSQSAEATTAAGSEVEESLDPGFLCPDTSRLMIKGTPLNKSRKKTYQRFTVSLFCEGTVEVCTNVATLLKDASLSLVFVSPQVNLDVVNGNVVQFGVNTQKSIPINPNVV